MDASPAGKGTRLAWRWGAVLALLLAAFQLRAAPTEGTSPEYKIKAVFLFNFAQFVDWPERAFETRTSPLIIGVLGADPFGSYLDDLVRGEKVSNRPIIVRRFRTPAEIDGCHILFVSRSEGAADREILSALRNRSILTVSDADQFASHGGMIRLVTEQGKIRLRINPDAVKAAGLLISSKILRVATLVSTDKD